LGGSATTVLATFDSAVSIRLNLRLPDALVKLVVFCAAEDDRRSGIKTGSNHDRPHEFGLTLTFLKAYKSVIDFTKIG
jgi:hypothetical protein